MPWHLEGYTGSLAQAFKGKFRGNDAVRDCCAMSVVCKADNWLMPQNTLQLQDDLTSLPMSQVELLMMLPVVDASKGAACLTVCHD